MRLYSLITALFFSFLITLPPPISTLFPYTTLFRSIFRRRRTASDRGRRISEDSRRLQRPPKAETRSPPEHEIGRAHGLNSSHVSISYAVFCLKKKKY